MIYFREGNIFNGKSDLIVIPCNVSGAISNSFHEGLNKIGVDRKFLEMKHGEVSFVKGISGKFKHLALAATVKDGIRTPKNIIVSICQKI